MKTANNVPRWSARSYAISVVVPSRWWVSARCAELLMGSHSVSPWMMARSISYMKVVGRELIYSSFAFFFSVFIGKVKKWSVQ